MIIYYQFWYLFMKVRNDQNWKFISNSIIESQDFEFIPSILFSFIAILTFCCWFVKVTTPTQKWVKIQIVVSIRKAFDMNIGIFQATSYLLDTESSGGLEGVGVGAVLIKTSQRAAQLWTLCMRFPTIYRKFSGRNYLF